MSEHPMQAVIKDSKGTVRFKENRIVSHILEVSRKNGCGLNWIAAMDFSDEDMMQLAQLLGYSIIGYGELSYVTDESYEAAEMLALNLKGYGE